MALAHWETQHTRGRPYSHPLSYLVNTGPGNAGLKSNVFWIWGGCCLIAAVITYVLVPETKQLSLEQIDLIYLNATPRTSAKYRRELVQGNIHLRRPSMIAAGIDQKKGTHEADHVETSSGSSVV